MSHPMQMELEIRDTMEQSNENQGIAADDAAVSTEGDDQEVNPPLTPPPYLKLIADCWEHIFDYLSMKDVLVMGQTCKRMHRMAGFYVREYFPELRFDLIEGEIQLQCYDSRYGYSRVHLTPNFNEFISKLCISNKSQLDFHLDGKMFPALKTLILKTTKSLEHLQDLMKNVENVHMEECAVKFKTIEQFAIHCPKLKSLHIISCDISDRALNSLFSQHFPMLEHLQYKAKRSPLQSATRIDELKAFLEIHSQLKHFGCRVRDVWKNREVLRKTSIQLNTLAVDFHEWDSSKKVEKFTLFLNELHERGFYKTLHLSLDEDSSISMEHFNELSAIEVLVHEREPSNYHLKGLTGLKELHAYCGFDDDDDIESASTSLIKLERLVIEHACIEEYLPFIRNSKRLKSIKANALVDEYEDVDVFALNEERKSTGGSPILLHLPESAYLRAKWNSKNLNLSHVEIARYVNQDDF